MSLPVALINVVDPPACLLCHRALAPSWSKPSGRALSSFHTLTTDALEDLLCHHCREDLPRCGPPVCQRCGLQLAGAFDAVLECAGCRQTAWAFDAARAPWRYEGAIREAVRQFKYARRWRLGRWLAQTMAITAQRSLPMDDIEIVLPIPSHWAKRWLKGFHPTRVLADTVARSLGKPTARGWLRRARWTTTQTRLRSNERFRNVAGAFRTTKRAARGLGILLVDDVLTSGATAHACALALKEAGARHVSVLTAARTAI